jgi:hypothetical protein
VVSRRPGAGRGHRHLGALRLAEGADPRVEQAALAIELVLLGLVAVGLGVTGPVWLGIAYGAVALVSGLVNYAFKP